MYGSKHLSNVALFPLCDASSVLTDALSVSADVPNTRGDALVFAWRLSLPERMSVAEAANAVLVVAMSVPRETWSRQQLLIVRELMVLAGREEPTRSKPVYAPTRAKRTVSVSRDNAPTDANTRTQENHPARRVLEQGEQGTERPLKPLVDKDLVPEQRKATPKEAKEWWRLVGRGEQTSKSSNAQRKTRIARVSREP